MTKSVAAIILGVALAGCGGDFSGPDAPTKATPPPTYVSVAGNYAGTVSITFPPQTTPAVSCPATTTVTQSNDLVYFSTLNLGAGCGTATSVPLPQLVIDTQGRVPSFPQTISQQDTCGVFSVVLDGGFSGNQFRLSEVFTPVSGTCQRQKLDITLTKQ